MTRPEVEFSAFPDERSAETILVHTGSGGLGRDLAGYLNQSELTGRVRVLATSQTRVCDRVLYHKWQRRSVLDETLPNAEAVPITRHVGWWVTSLQHQWLTGGSVHQVVGRPTGADRGAVWTPLYGYGRDGALIVCCLPSVPEAEEMFAVNEMAG